MKKIFLYSEIIFQSMKTGIRLPPFGWVVCAFSGGIVLGETYKIPVVFPAVLFLGVWLCSLLLWKTRVLIKILLGILLVFAGMIYQFSHQLFSVKDIHYVSRYYKSQPVELKGTIVSDTHSKQMAYGLKTTRYVRLEEIKAPWGWEEVRGKILLQTFRPFPARYADQIQFSGRLHKPFGFDREKHQKSSYEQYLNHRGIYWIVSVKKARPIKIIQRGKGFSLRRRAYSLSDQLKNILDKRLTEQESGVMKAILLGDRGDIPRHLKELFFKTGTIHILAISGLHVGIIASMVMGLLCVFPLGRKVRVVLTVIFLIGYIFISGARPSTVRACTMACVLLMAFIVERKADAWNNLFIAAFVLLLFNPMYLYDIGFQLSFICVGMILICYPLLKSMADGIEMAPLIRQMIMSLGMSFLIWLGVAGLIARHFQIVTPVAVIANLYVIPCLTIVVSLGFGVLITHAAAPMLVEYFILSLRAVLNCLVGGVYLFHKIPFAFQSVGAVEARAICLYYTVLVLVLFLLKIFARRSSQNKINL
ncbi:MAG: ComEC family competence protein [Candidatus Omnitrophica bacterium]|nr:ComEC family competence protein [Candidatus Omnitrophota bacterium]